MSPVVGEVENRRAKTLKKLKYKYIISYDIWVYS
jgi:hypothetical protein